MTFLYAPMLYLLLVPILFFVFSLRRNRNSMEHLFSKTVLAQLQVNGGRLQRPVRYRLFLLAIALFIIALARPVMQEKQVAGTPERIPVVIALDVSLSMHLKDLYPDRLSLALQKLKTLISKSSAMNIGILFFDKNAYRAYPVSEDTAAAEYMLEHMTMQQRFEANSNIFAALEAGVTMLHDYAYKSMIVLSDGGNSDDVTQEIAYLKKNRMTLYAIGVATQKGARLSGKDAPVSRRNPTLKTMAVQSGGGYEDVSWSENDVDAILSRIRKNARRESQETYGLKHSTELFTYPLALGVLLLFFVFNAFFKRKEPVLLAGCILLTLFLPQTKLQAGLLDFMTLHRAKALYEQQDFEASAKRYKTVARSREGYYNLACALYKAHRYAEAISIYRKSLSDDPAMNAKIFHNIGNAYFQKNELKLAKKYYENALALAHHRVTEENLAIVNEAIMQQKNEKEKKKPKRKRRCKSIEVKERIAFEEPESSAYRIDPKALVLSEEQYWMKRVRQQQAPVLLQKIETTRESRNVEQPW